MSDALSNSWMESNARNKFMDTIDIIVRRIYRDELFENKEEQYNIVCRDIASLIKSEIERLEHGQ